MPSATGALPAAIIQQSKISTGWDQVIELIQQLQAPILGADIVELNPKRDPSEIIAMAAVKILKEVSTRMLELPIDFK